MSILGVVEPGQGSQEEQGVEELPLVPLYGTVIFPHMIMPLQVGRPKALKAIEEALLRGRQVFLVAQRTLQEEAGPQDLYPIGTVGSIEHVLRLPDGGLQVHIHGVARARLLDCFQAEPFFKAHVHRVEDHVEKTMEIEALMRSVMDLIDRYTEIAKSVPPEVIAAVKSIQEPGRLADMVAFAPEFTFEQRQQVLEELDPVSRLRIVAGFLSRQLEIMEIKARIQDEVQKGFEKIQREHYLREQLKAIQKELGEDTPEASITKDLRERIEKAGMPEEVHKRALEEVERLLQIPFTSPETAVVRNYIEWLAALPWSHETPDNLDLKAASQVLDEDHYGLEKVKERILEYMAVRKLSQQSRSPIICFVGPPGVGKTSLGKSIARALGRTFVRLSLGGLRDEAEIRGHRRTYVGALPGRIIQGMRNAGSRNPIFMLDEIDKVGIDFRGDPSAALLEALDPEQNHSFSDHYLEVPFDLSRVIFITTANHVEPIIPALRDRLEIIEIPGYTELEKLGIAGGFLIPRQIEQHGLDRSKIRLSDEALRRIIREYTREAGVRNLEREIANVCRKVARRIAEGRQKLTLLREGNLPSYLGPPRFLYGMAEERDEIGVATGVYWTPMGGDLVTVEVNAMEGKPELILTGQLGNVMQESARAALSYTRSHASILGIKAKFFENHVIHIHVPEGAVPKDGPSAGITMATALVSALTQRPVRRDVAMTGEITLRGRVLPVGGLKEKVLAAHRAGMKTFILPAKNKKDLTQIPPHVMREVDFVYVEQIEEALAVALLDRASDDRQAA